MTIYETYIEPARWALGEWWRDLHGRHGLEFRLWASVIGLLGVGLIVASVYGILRSLTGMW